MDRFLIKKKAAGTDLHGPGGGGGGGGASESACFNKMVESWSGGGPGRSSISTNLRKQQQQQQGKSLASKSHLHSARPHVESDARKAQTNRMPKAYTARPLSSRYIEDVEVENDDADDHGEEAEDDDDTSLSGFVVSDDEDDEEDGDDGDGSASACFSRDGEHARARGKDSDFMGWERRELRCLIDRLVALEGRIDQRMEEHFHLRRRLSPKKRAPLESRNTDGTGRANMGKVGVKSTGKQDRCGSGHGPQEKGEPEIKVDEGRPKETRRRVRVVASSDDSDEELEDLSSSRARPCPRPRHVHEEEQSPSPVALSQSQQQTQSACQSSERKQVLELYRAWLRKQSDDAFCALAGRWLCDFPITLDPSYPFAVLDKPVPIGDCNAIEAPCAVLAIEAQRRGHVPLGIVGMRLECDGGPGKREARTELEMIIGVGELEQEESFAFQKKDRMYVGAAIKDNPRYDSVLLACTSRSEERDGVAVTSHHHPLSLSAFVCV